MGLKSNVKGLSVVCSQGLHCCLIVLRESVLVVLLVEGESPSVLSSLVVQLGLCLVRLMLHLTVFFMPF